MDSTLHYYRAWGGSLGGSWRAVLAIAEQSLRLILRRRLFWVLYVLALLNFVVFFSGIYLLYQLDVEQLLEGAPTSARIGFIRIRDLEQFLNFLRKQLYLAGTAETYRNFFWYQGYITMALLAFTGAQLIGQDYSAGALPFFLSKPIRSWHYVLGKFLAVCVIVNAMTTLPALALFVECGLLIGWDYFAEEIRLAAGSIAYGMVLTASLGSLVLAVAARVKRTVPLVLVWAVILILMRGLASTLVDGLRYDVRWRLLDLWNSTYVIGSAALGAAAKLETSRRWLSRPQPELWEVACVLGALVVLAWVDLLRRVRPYQTVG